MGKRIMIVDDSPMIHNILKKILVKHGHDVCGSAYNGKEGVELYESLQPDLVFMDITMPVMEGIPAARLIKENNPNAKVIMLTAMGDESIMEEALKSGIDIFLKKPFDEYKIVSAIAKVI